ncbi:hypothetical protein [Paucilactobacillus wasatchensis]|nr:hypothetical protein [Paucilactobacillus wasatchensis]
MFIYEYDHEYGEDKYGMVGKPADPFQENCRLNIQCGKCHQQPMVIAERNVMDVNRDDSTQYQIVISCPYCRTSDEFFVNQGREGKISKAKRAHQRITPADVIKKDN